MMLLTPDLVAKVHRVVPEPAPPPAATLLGDADYAVLVERLLEGWQGGDFHVFVYGSLLWKPACPVDGEMPALLRGWHRRFCLMLERFRGTPEQPGLMMALDRGGACRGAVQRLSGGDIPERLLALLRREMVIRPAANVPRWMTVETAGGPVRAMGFVADRRHSIFVRPSLDETVAILACACGYAGSGAEYLANTVTALAERGIRDSYLWQLQALVAERIKALP
jgi:cation transport protein ChaC